MTAAKRKWNSVFVVDRVIGSLKTSRIDSFAVKRITEKGILHFCSRALRVYGDNSNFNKTGH
jgi:hypothetical protein